MNVAQLCNRPLNNGGRFYLDVNKEKFLHENKDGVIVQEFIPSFIENMTLEDMDYFFAMLEKDKR